MEVVTGGLTRIILLLCYTLKYSLFQHIILIKNMYFRVSSTHTHFSLFYCQINWQLLKRKFINKESSVNMKRLESSFVLINILKRELEGDIKSLLVKCADDTIFILPLADWRINITNNQADIQRHVGCLVNWSLPSMIFSWFFFGFFFSHFSFLFCCVWFFKYNRIQTQDTGNWRLWKG